jgi:hypothetical protein
MDDILQIIKSEVYDKCGLKMSDFSLEAESKEYEACRFELNGMNIVCRSAKITPAKAGQFVTFWKRKGSGPIEPFHLNDKIDFFVVNVQFNNQLGQFVFPVSLLIEKGIISTPEKEGKRAFRVYTVWDENLNRQAEQTQRWQLKYFYEIGNTIDSDKVSALYKGT